MKTLVTGALGATEEELNMLRSAGLDITIHPDERQPVDHPDQYETVICNGLFLHNDISAFTNLRYVQLTSTGYDRVPLDYIQAHGIQIYNASGVYSVPMAEWTIMRILELYKNAARLFTNQAAHMWEKDRSWQELTGKTACIIGFGAYGQQVAKRLKAFDVQILAVNRTMKASPFVDGFYPLEQLDFCLSQADIVILAIALTDKTRNLLSKKRIAAIKPGAILINAARGGLIDEAALAEALKSGYIAGAALDVFANEPLSKDSPLWNTDTVLISPHNSFVGANNHSRLIQCITANLSLPECYHE